MNKCIPVLILSVALSSAASYAHEKGDIVLRAGAATVAPDASSDPIVITDGLVLPNGVDVGNNTQLGLTLTYMLHDKFGVELLAATPFDHDITLNDAPVKVGSTKHLPPTLSLQWFPLGGTDSGFQPYVGAGVNYTRFFDESVTDEFRAALGGLVGAGGAVPAEVSLGDSWGLAAQAGIDIPLGDHWMLNAAVWYIDIKTEATVRTPLPDVKFDVNIDPWVYNVGVAYRF